MSFSLNCYTRCATFLFLNPLVHSLISLFRVYTNTNVASLRQRLTQFFYSKLFYSLNDIWTEQTAEIATSLLNQFNTSSSLLFQVSVICLFRLQQIELAPTSPLMCWTSLQEFHQY